MDPNMTKHSGRDRQRSNGSAPRLLMAMSAFLAVACVVTADKGAHGHVARATSVIVQDAAPGSAGRCRQSPHTCVADPLNFTARTPLRTAWLSIIAVNDNNVVFRGLASVVNITVGLRDPASSLHRRGLPTSKLFTHRAALQQRAVPTLEYVVCAGRAPPLQRN
jgi:hypothetical protein